MNRNIWRVLALRGALLGAVLPHAGASAAIWYVHADAAPSGDGTSWATASDEIQDIVPPALQSGDQIWVAGGTTTVYLAPITAYDAVSIYGGFPPTGNPAFGSRNSGLYPTIIDASGSNTGIEVENGASQFTRIEGLTIDGAGVFGILNGNRSQAIFDSLTLKNNGFAPLASVSGAFQNGIDYAFARVTNSVFENNFGVSGGGAFRNPESSSFRIERCVFRENSASVGGAIFNAGLEVPTGCNPGPCDDQPIPIVRLSVFENNTAGSFAGALFQDGDIKILACTLTGNSAPGGGGALFGVAGRTILEDTALQNNETLGSGAAIGIVRGCELSSYSCLFSRNVAGQGGGAVHALAMNKVLFQNATVIENVAAQFSGIYAEVDNHACTASTPFEAAIENCILWNNGCVNQECTDYREQLNVTVGAGGTLLVDYNDLRNLPLGLPAGFGAHNIDADPQFRDPATFNYRLLSTSPCIDAATAEVIPQDGDDADGDSRTTCDGCDIEDSGEHIPDLDLARRIVDAPAVTDTGLPPLDNCPLECSRIPDIGCHEYVACANCAMRGDLNGDGLLNGLDIDPFVKCVIHESAAQIACLCGDFSGPAGVPDGVVDWYDVPCFIELLLTDETSCPGPILCDAPSPGGEGVGGGGGGQGQTPTGGGGNQSGAAGGGAAEAASNSASNGNGEAGGDGAGSSDADDVWDPMNDPEDPGFPQRYAAYQAWLVEHPRGNYPSLSDDDYDLWTGTVALDMMYTLPTP